MFPKPKVAGSTPVVRFKRPVKRHLTAAFGVVRPLRPDDIMVVAPYNAQVRCLREHLPEDVKVGTVDKFQGQEGAVAFFSMAVDRANRWRSRVDSGSAADDRADDLGDRHRLECDGRRA